ncbi:uncharacterized protein BDR25DRAFT_302228 [Lindgomyces ingoldianus]|uniref:Uncharacterized protein n=1 Tax=Lindgomyces ingoldianus TaxID=673940 RepID=A0ACB6R263_9PLEO|nr:uncharacterized protein BDR25DRAFT_302228 [Lindgomyces ingoldianus]KAF2473266.1 hypothetical protein BDR25DRAFT_302228 [Lindgomyces ingoldianus]
MVFRRLPWELACALFSLTAMAGNVAPSNQTTRISTYSGSISLQAVNGQNLTELVSLTRKAIVENGAPIHGNLYNTNESSVGNITSEDISYISCDSSVYPGNIDGLKLFEAAWQKNISAAIFYSTTSDFCNYTGLTEQLQDYPIFSSTNKDNSKKILADLQGPVSIKFIVNIERFGGGSDGNNQSGHGNRGSNDPNNQNPLGPSPSTAVAMIILYSITGIITALFLVIIITGAVRAHRHPDRYGPRDVLGRPRQSRARGLGRAILDTIPIVKFGEREPPKPTDVEMGSTSEPRNANNANTEGGGQNNQDGSETPKAPEQTEASRDVGDEQQEGIAPAQPLAAGAASPSSQENGSADEGLGCSICTDDFEKGQDIRVLPCNHKFHPECVDPWLLNVSGTCPLCRVDLRPTTSRTSTTDDDNDPELLAPPLQPEAEASNRRRSALRDILSLRSRPNASAEERISALRRLREQRRNQSREDASGSMNGSTDDVTAVRRSRRISTRLHDVFSVRTRRSDQDDPAPYAEASSSFVQPATSEPGPSSSSGGGRDEDLPELRR